MGSLFPSGVGMSHVRGIVSIVKDNNGVISLSKLAEEAEEDVDDLLPLIEASKALGLIRIVNSDVKLTEKGKELTSASTRRAIREGLVKIEPFKTTVKALSGGSKTTLELFDYLAKRGIFDDYPEFSSESLLKLLVSWGVRSKLLSYDEQNDSWLVRK